jgi:lipopolysaccharide transport system ATP-binding protein
MAEPIISVHNISKRYTLSHVNEKTNSFREALTNKVKGIGKRSSSKSQASEEFWALDDISFDIQQGDRVGIIGRNGAGKSTLLKILSRITEPTRGSIDIRGRVASLLEVGTGFHPELTGRENVFLNGAILGMSRVEIKAKFDEIVAFAEVEKFIDTPVKRYSSGMYVRLAFAVAAHLEPEILVVDEVLAVGDAEFQKKCLGKMEDVSKNGGRTVLFVSHQLGMISQLCNKGLLLHRGKIIEYSSTIRTVDKYIQAGNYSGSVYSPGSHSANLKNHFTEAMLINNKSVASSNFAFSESITIKFEFVVREIEPTLQIGIGINDKFQNRVCTVIKPISFFNSSNSIYKGMVQLPAALFAPNHYSIVLALWTKDGKVYDLQNNALPLTIHDDGTDLALYEGIDYGAVIINPIWRNAI